MIEWQKKYGKQGLVIVGVMPRYFSASPSTLRRIAESMGINYKLARWEKEQNKLPKPLSLVPTYPASLLIDRKGRLKSGVFGPWLTQLEKDLKAALAEKPEEQQTPITKGESKPTKTSNR